MTKRILIIEEEIIIASDIEMTLKKFDYPAPVIINTIAEAEKNLITGKYDLLIVDFGLAEPTYIFEISEKLSKGFHVPVLFLTTYQDLDNLKEKKSEGFYNYVIKPFEEEELILAIEKEIYFFNMKSALIELNTRYEKILKNVNEGIIVLNRDSFITYMNNSAKILTAYNFKDKKSIGLSEICKLFDQDGNNITLKLNEISGSHPVNNSPKGAPVSFKEEQSHEIFFKTYKTKSCILENNKQKEIPVNLQIITIDSDNLLLLLQRSNEITNDFNYFFDRIASDLPLGLIYMDSQGYILNINPFFQANLGFISLEQTVNRNITDYIDQKSDFINCFNNSLETGKNSYLKMDFLENYKKFPFDCSLIPLKINNIEGILGVFPPVSISEPEKECLNMFINNLPFPALIIHENKIIVLNENLKDLSGFKEEFLLNSDPVTLFGESTGKALDNFYNCNNENKSLNISDGCIINSEGNKINVKIFVKELENTSNPCYQIILWDISREILLKEANENELSRTKHKFRNNLQLIDSIFSIQIKNCNEEDNKTLYTEVRNRIKIIGYVSEAIINFPDDQQNSLLELIRKITVNLFKSYKVNTNRIRLDLEIEDLLIDARKLVPLGLIINELVTNSLKHGFKNELSGTLTIELKKLENYYLLLVKDNGSGLPKGFDPVKNSNTGLQLVNELVIQIEGELKVKMAEGTNFIIIFKN